MQRTLAIHRACLPVAFGLIGSLTLVQRSIVRKMGHNLDGGQSAAGEIAATSPHATLSSSGKASSLQSWLGHVILEQHAGRSSVHAVSVGNEAGDLDSIVSALGLAFLSSHTNRFIDRTHSNPSSRDSATLVLPLVPFARGDFRLRRDAVFLFKLAGFLFDDVTESPNNLIFHDDDVKDAVVTTTNGRDEDEAVGVPFLLLTDHNKRTIKHPLLENAKVIEIVDHHADSGDHSHVKGSFRNIVSGLGSTCTLVAELLLDAHKKGQCPLPEDLSLLLLATIVLDSRNWSSSRGTLRDRKAFDNLMAQHPSLSKYFEDDLYGRVSEARHDISMLDFDDLLRLDYKNCDTTTESSHRSGISSIMGSLRTVIADSCPSHHFNHEKSLPELALRDITSVWASLERFRARQSLDIAIAFTKKCPTDERKHIIIVANPINGSDAVEPIALARDLTQYLIGAPSTLPADLLSDQNLIKQKVPKKGLGAQLLCQFEAKAGESEVGRGVFLIVSVSPKITRKSLKPIVESWLSK